jgi:hypothetical protein
MELLNATGMQASYTMGMRPDGRELLVVVVKGTFDIPKSAAGPKLASEQFPIVEADTFTGEPGLSAPVYESDYAPVKARCDVLVNGSAYAPYGVPTTRVRVSLQVGEVDKHFDVVGDRVWKSDAFGASHTEPEPFTRMPISYDVAFGGVDNLDLDPSKHEAHFSNPVGVGFYPRSKAEQIDGKSLPNTEETGRPVDSPKGVYNAMSFGPIGRGWPPRTNYAGTYDQDWIDNVFPFLPEDFDDRYYQSAPMDQQMDRLRGGEEVMLLNLTPEGQTVFRLPKIEIPVTFYFKNYEEKEIDAVGDTLIVEPDLGCFVIVWRASLPLRKNMFEVAQIVAGRMPSGWYRARELGKTYYPSLKVLVDVRRGERGDTGENAEESEEVEETDA